MYLLLKQTFFKTLETTHTAEFRILQGDKGYAKTYKLKSKPTFLVDNAQIRLFIEYINSLIFQNVILVFKTQFMTLPLCVFEKIKNKNGILTFFVIE